IITTVYKPAVGETVGLITFDPTQTVLLSGTPKKNETWQVQLDGGASKSYTVQTFDLLTDVAQGVADLINADGDYFAPAQDGGTNLVVRELDGTRFAMTVTPPATSGQMTVIPTVRAGDSWNVKIGNNKDTVYVAPKDSVNDPSDDIWAVANKLMVAINNNATL